MKLVETLLIAAVVVTVAPAALAAGDAAPPTKAAQSPALPSALAEGLFAPTGGCEPGMESAPAAEGQDPVALTGPLDCGACSASVCLYAPIGQACYVPGPKGGWGNCNTYNDAGFCSTGGLECSCGSGPL
ncbi:MAG TPA: hypothetical protein VHQ65_07870 [Thermoanaerobaculia bacterium]|nr:hypothetical protein [Thermoanaerobaculia bacterium]